jgi:hypothetical protein
MIRDAFHHQAPFVGSGGSYGPGPATSTPLLAMGKPLDDDLSPPWVFRRSSPVFTGESDSLCTLRSTRSPTASPAGFRSELGPRSLDPAALFGARVPSLFETRRSLMISATALTTCGQPNPGSYDPRRDGDLDLLPFLRRATPSTCIESDTRRAALRPPNSAPVLVPLTRVSLPNRDAKIVCPTSEACAAEHSEDQRARASGPSEGRVPWRLRRFLVPASGACAFWRMPSAFPS